MGPSSRVAIVTGASRGIGRAIASRLAADGFAVVVNYTSKRGEAEQVIEAIRAAGGKAVAIQADVSKQEDVTRLFEETGRHLGGVDVLVNNAGIMELKMMGRGAGRVIRADLCNQRARNVLHDEGCGQGTAKWRSNHQLLEQRIRSCAAYLRGVQRVQGGGRGPDEDRR